MVKNIVSGLLFAAAFVASPASAADFLIYTFNASGTSYTYANATPFSAGVMLRDVASQAQLIYYLPLGDFARVGGGQISTSSTHSTYTMGSLEPVPGRRDASSSVFDAGVDRLTFSDSNATRDYRGGAQQKGSASVCGSFGGLFATQSFAADARCSTASVTGSASYGTHGGISFGFTGTVNSVDVAFGYGAPTTYGLAQATILPVPEPSTWAMMLTGFAAIGWLLRRPRRGAVMAAAARDRGCFA